MKDSFVCYILLFYRISVLYIYFRLKNIDIYVFNSGISAMFHLIELIVYLSAGISRP